MAYAQTAAAQQLMMQQAMMQQQQQQQQQQPPPPPPGAAAGVSVEQLQYQQQQMLLQQQQQYQQQYQQQQAMQAQYQQQQAMQQHQLQQQQLYQQQQQAMQQRHMQMQQQGQQHAMQQQAQMQGQSRSVIGVSGCGTPAVAQIIHGSFVEAGENHGKPVFKKEGGPDAIALIYFWDERDGPGFCGWWFGPAVGGDQVWAYNGNTTASAPPTSGWKVPWDGPEDPGLVLSYMQAGMPPAGPPPPGPPPAAGHGYAGEHYDGQACGQQEDQRWQEDQARRQEEAAMWTVREVMQRLRSAQPENLEEIRGELEKVKTDHWEWLSKHAAELEKEVESAEQAAQERVSEILRKRDEDEKKRIEDEALAEQLSKEVADEVADAEAKVMQVDEAAKPMIDCVEDPVRETQVDTAHDIEKEVLSLRELLDSVSSSLSAKKADVAASELGRKRLREEWVGHFGKLAKCRRKVAHLKASTEAFHELASRKIAAAREESECKALHSKYDQDQDGVLSRVEVQALVAGEYTLELQEGQLDQIFASTVKGQTGVPPEMMPRLRTLLSLFKSEVDARDVKAKAEEEERRKKEEEARRLEEVAHKKEELKKECQAVREVLNQAGTAVVAAEDAWPIVTMFKTSMLLRGSAAEAEGLVVRAREAIGRAMQPIAECAREKETHEDYRRFQADEVGRLHARVAQLSGRLDKTLEACNAAREAASMREEGEAKQKESSGELEKPKEESKDEEEEEKPSVDPEELPPASAPAAPVAEDTNQAPPQEAQEVSQPAAEA